MYFANNALGVRTYIDDADAKQKYECPVCGDVMIQKRGQIVTHHFAHKAGKHCDSWYSGKFSAWHKEMQNLFPESCRELIVWNSDRSEYHIADVVYRGGEKSSVIEFQHTPISQDEFILRSKFYLSCGYRLIWIFDFCEIKKPKTIFYKDCDCNDKNEIQVIWPGKDRVRFIDNINFSGVENSLHIYLYISTGKGRSQWIDSYDYSSWEIWEYLNPFHREQYYVKLDLTRFESLREFYAQRYTKEVFYQRLKKVASSQEK